MKLLCGVLLLAASAFAQLNGTVRDSASKLPVEKAKIFVYGPAASKSVESGSTGAFLVEDLPAGKYLLTFTKNGYDDGSASVEVKPGGGSVTLELNPWGEIEGQILDDDGRPLEGVLVYVGGGLHDTTDKGGHYRASQIPPGKFTFTFRLPYVLRRKTAQHDAKTGETLGYPGTMYYPGVADAKLSAPIFIGAGARMTSFDVRLRRTRLVDVKGKVVGAPAGAEIELDASGNRPDETYARRKLDEHGGFLFDLLAPGEHSVAIYRNRAGDDLPYITPAVPGLDVVMPPFVRIDGMVRTVHPELEWEGPLRVTLGRLGYNTEVRVPEGRFALENIPPGMWQLTLDDNLVHRAGDARRRVYAMGLAKMLRVTESGNPTIEIVLTDETGKLTGTAEDPVPITIVSDGRMRHAFPARDGTFAVDLPPGEYQVTMTGRACKQESVTIEPGGTASVHLQCRAN